MMCCWFQNLNNYLKTIKYLISQNYYVIRITNNYSKKLGFKKNYFELNINKKFNKELQYFFIHKSLGLISSQSGPAAISTLLSKPILELNMNNAYPHGLNKKSLFLLKKLLIFNLFIKSFTILVFVLLEKKLLID